MDLSANHLHCGNQTWFAGKCSPFIDDFPLKTSIDKGVPIATFWIPNVKKKSWPALSNRIEVRCVPLICGSEHCKNGNTFWTVQGRAGSVRGPIAYCMQSKEHRTLASRGKDDMCFLQQLEQTLKTKVQQDIWCMCAKMHKGGWIVLNI